MLHELAEIGSEFSEEYEPDQVIFFTGIRLATIDPLIGTNRVRGVGNPGGQG